MTLGINGGRNGLKGLNRKALPKLRFRRQIDPIPLVPAGLPKALDLGSGSNPKNIFSAREVWGVDFVANPQRNVVAADLSADPIPFPHESFAIISAHDFIEHIPRVSIGSGRTVFPFVELMNEIVRVLQPGGFFFSETPAFPASVAFQDPTHVNIITEDTFRLYFSGESWAGAYGFSGGLRFVAQKWNRGHLRTLMQKVENR